MLPTLAQPGRPPRAPHRGARLRNPNPGARLPAAQDLDPEALAALPPDIRRELRLAFMARRAAPRAGAPPAQRARAAAPGTMERFLTRRKG